MKTGSMIVCAVLVAACGPGPDPVRGLYRAALTKPASGDTCPQAAPSATAILDFGTGFEFTLDPALGPAATCSVTNRAPDYNDVDVSCTFTGASPPWDDLHMILTRDPAGVLVGSLSYASAGAATGCYFLFYDVTAQKD